MTHPAISGVAIDILLFSRIGLPLFHRYRIISHAGTHAAFRGTYMKRLYAFLNEMDEEWLRHRRHRRHAKEMAARMSLSSGPTIAPVPAKGRVFLCSLPPAEASTVQALIDLSLPRFAGLGVGPQQVQAPGAASVDSPASPATSRLDTSGEENRGRSGSLCLDLDELSSSDDDIATLVGLDDLLVTLLCGFPGYFQSGPLRCGFSPGASIAG